MTSLSPKSLAYDPPETSYADYISKMVFKIFKSTFNKPLGANSPY